MPIQHQAIVLAASKKSDLLRTSLAASSGALALAASLWFAHPVHAQDTQIIYPGSMAVSGFSGTWIPGIEEGLPPGVDAVDETFIDPERASLRVFDVSNLGAPPSGQLVNTPLPFEVLAKQIGQVFGLTYDDGETDAEETNVPNLYAASSSLHGIRIVTPDEDADGRPERQRRGTPGATFMEGQFAEENGGNPGAIWKIDGRTGAVSLFTKIETNSGPGLGDVAFDTSNRQFFATDLDTGLIHRIAMDGTLIDNFDHGVAGRPARGLAAVADDGAVMDIQGAAFDTEDFGTWGLTQDERRVWAVQVHGGRAYYSVGDKAEIWSVGINRDGTFANDARWELTVTAEQDFPVTDIAFDGRGFMYLAQRGEIENRYDYSQIADSGEGVVLRYWRESPDNPATESIWVEAPQEYAVGFPAGYRQTAGGLDLQYGYYNDGTFNRNACSDTLVKTGDKLRDNPEYAEQLAAGGPLAVHGVQITDSALVRPKNEPPFGSWFVDYDSFYEDPEVEGHVGDVEVWRPCDTAGFYEEVPGGVLPPFYPPEFPPDGDIPPCIDVEVEFWCTPAGLEADLYLQDVAGIGGDSLKSESRTPGVLVSPFQQTQPLGTPYTIGITGHLPGEDVTVGLCFYKQSDADKGGYYPCCKMNVTLDTPGVACAP
ncbi:MAG TPA: hypothetical protein VMF90_14315 [Rhizobiaceae bacterium]|nr:hypothetical protein [Rhizobiaceae bacterium]